MDVAQDGGCSVKQLRKAEMRLPQWASRRRESGRRRSGLLLSQQRVAIFIRGCRPHRVQAPGCWSLAQELSVALSITEEDDLASLKVAQCIQVYLSLQQWPTVAAPKEMERACASFVRGPRERGVKGLQPEQEWCWRDSLPAWGSATTCFKYGQQGHIARGLPEQRRIIRITFYGFCPAGIRFPGLTGKSRHIRHSAAIVISRISVAAQVQSTRHHPSSRCGTRAVVSGVEWVAVLRKPME
ncbi:unnamed protein product [Lampetra planeri]